VTLGTSSLTAGGTTDATATLRDASGNVLTGRPVTWRSSNGAVASVNPGGTVTAVGAGSANITASSGDVSGSASVTVTAPPPVVARITVAPGTLNLRADNDRRDDGGLVAVAFDARGNIITGVTFTWTVDDASVVSISGTALGSAAVTVHALKKGDATVRARAGDVSDAAAVHVR
jgi:uncharacterized protein YjdB